MSQSITITLAKGLTIDAIARLATQQGVTRNAMLNNLLKAGIAYYHNEQLRQLLSRELGQPIPLSKFTELIDDFGGVPVADTWDDFKEYCIVMLAEDADAPGL